MKENKKYLQFQLETSRDHPDYFHIEKYLSDGYYAHFHRNPELYCVYAGSVRVSVGKNEYPSTSGDADFINSLQVHSYLCDEKAEIAFVLFGEQYLQPFRQPYPNQSIPAFLNDKNANRALFAYIEKYGDRKSDFAPLEAFAHTSIILHMLVSAYGTAERPDPQKKSADFVIADIIQYIYDNSANEISLESLAEHFGYSPMTLSHLISKHVKIDLRNFINDIRVQKVIAMQAQPEYKNVSTLELASLCGFKSISSFYRAFKRSSGNK